MPAASAWSGGAKRARDRSQLSFFIVVIFFAVFALIVLTEVFLIDERTAQERRLASYQDLDSPLLAGGMSLNGGGGGAALLAAAAAVGGADQLGDPVGPPADGVWQPVAGTRFKFFVYSAFLDMRLEPMVRIVGATRTRAPERVWCQLWLPGNKSMNVPARVKPIRENWNLKYSACFIICPLGRNSSTMLPPKSVSVVSWASGRGAHLAGNHLLVRIPPPVSIRMPPRIVLSKSESSAGAHAPPKTPSSLAVCVKPLHFVYNRVIPMLEFLELNRLLGVSHFTLYNHTIGSQVGCVLRSYEEKGIVSLLPWQLDMISQKEIRTEGLFAALNDCLYRGLGSYTYLALIDLDEFIIPRSKLTLIELLQKLTTARTGAFSFQNGFFYLQWPDDAEFSTSTSNSPTLSSPELKATQKNDAIKNDYVEELELVTVRKTRRRAKLHPHKQRSKYVCRPERVVEAGNHFVWELLPGFGTLNVPASNAILHHYRVCEFGGDDCIRAANLIDRTAHRFRVDLTLAVRNQYESLQQKCNLPQL